MIRDGFDYERCWTKSLEHRSVVVHALGNWHADLRTVERYSNGELLGTTEQRLIRCHHGVTWEARKDAAGHWEGANQRGVYLYAQHALALGAHFCEHCWPGGR